MSILSICSFEYLSEYLNLTSKDCTHLHPGYGFLSESPSLPRALAEAGSVVFIGPSSETLELSSNKLLSRNLATSLGVNVAPGVRVNCVADIHVFAQGVGYPIIIKALDGGGGRGIRVADSVADVEEAFKRSGYRLTHVFAQCLFTIFAPQDYRREPITTDICRTCSYRSEVETY